MWAIGVFVLFCTFLTPKIQGQTFGTLREPRPFLEAVVQALWGKITEHGISNLPVVDTRFIYNYTGFGVELVGPISFEDGFVQDIDSFSLDVQGFQNGAPLDRAFITGHIIFNNLRVYTDLRADLATGLKIGNVVFTPASFVYELSLTQMHGNETVNAAVSFISYSGITWDAHPDDIEMNLIRRQVLNQTNLWTPTDRPDLLWPTARGWVPLMTEFVNEILETMEFPIIEF